MKKIMLFAFAFLAVSHVVNCQTWFPIKSTWHYSQLHIDTTTGYYFSSFHKMEIAKDTVLLGLNCKMIERSSGSCDLYPMQIFVREEAGVVYFLNYTLTAFDTLIDMNKNIGDQWVIKPNVPVTSDSVFVTVTGKGIKIINGDTLAALRVNLTSNDWDWSATDSIIEKIGFYSGPFLFQYANCNFQVGSLRCYEDSDLGLFETGESGFCEEEIGAAINEFDDVNLMFPNPAKDYVNFSSVNKINKIYIYSIDYKKVVDFETDGDSDAVIDISTLKQGKYIVVIESNSESVCKMLLKTN